MVDREHTQTRWKNTYFTYKRQFTMIDGLIAETKICSNKLHDPEDETEGKDARRLIEPIEHIYIFSLVCNEYKVSLLQTPVQLD